MYRPSRRRAAPAPRRHRPSRALLPSRWLAPLVSTPDEETGFPFPNLSFSQFAEGRGNLQARQEAELDESGVRSMRRRVVPPTSFHGRVPEDLLNAVQVDVEEASTGGMDSGYYTDLLVNGEQQSQDITPSSDPTPPSDPTILNARATAKSSLGRSKISEMRRTFSCQVG
ncbi:glutathione S-transferase T3-like [Panicum miliaceum]|uniref:Glutathione S-transferase T3-like n=1 Tax=Panicum miliaceum TaxID=4540 RepID=A0A3L6QI61_PANMI|nr:glutathione S-transferase T3-like [Panicum miliaceum]